MQSDSRDASPPGASAGRSARWSTEDAFARTETAVRLAWVRQFARQGRVLVVGYRDGTVVAALASREGTEVTVLDDRPGLIANADPAPPASVSLRVAAVDDPPFDDASFDLVVALPAPSSRLERLVALLRPDGVLLVSVPTADRSHAEVVLGRSLATVRSARVDVVSAAVLWDGRTRPENVVADLVDTPSSAAAAWYFAAGPGSLPALGPVVALAGQDAIAELRMAGRHLEGALASAEAEVRRVRTELELMGDVRDQLLRAQPDAAALIEMRFERDVLTGELAAMEARNERAIAEIEHLGQVIHELRQSTSWRVTAPMRRMSSVVKR